MMLLKYMFYLELFVAIVDLLLIEEQTNIESLL